MTPNEHAVDPPPPTEEQILGEISGMIAALLDDYGLDAVEITMRSRFAEDLELESIDLVTLAEQLQRRWGDRVNLAELIAGLDLQEIIDLTVGQLVRHVADRLRTAGRS